MKTGLEKFCDIWMSQMPEEHESSIIEVDWHEISGELSELIEEEEQVKNHGVIGDVSKCTTFHSPDFSGKCMICKEQVFIRCPECKCYELKELAEESTYQCNDCDKVFSV